MSNALRFHPLPRSGDEPPVTIWVNGQALSAQAGWSVAAALLSHGFTAFRHGTVDGRPTGPFCLMGACFACLVRIDDTPSLQACMTQVRAGMRIELPRDDRAVL